MRGPTPEPHPASWPEPLALLLGEPARGLLAAATAAAGADLVRCRPRQVNHQPGSSTTVQYRVDARWPDGRTSAETFVARIGRGAPRGTATFTLGSHQASVWRWPHDPGLPGLADALDRDRLAGLFDSLGLDPGAPEVRVRAHRPGRRAVVEVRGPRHRLFLKVVRPDRAEALHRRHRLLAGHLPVPESLGWTDAGVVVLTALPGRTLRDALRSGGPLPEPSTVTGLLDALPASLAAGPARRDLVAAAGHHAEVIADHLPAARTRLARLRDALEPFALPDGHAVAPVHGDLYEAQLLVSGDRIVGLLDVDTAGPGCRVDDLANFVGHLSVLGLGLGRTAAVNRWGAALLREAERRHDRREVRHRVAAAIVGLATGPFRVLEPGWPDATLRRLDLARDWIAGASRRGADERGLTSGSRRPHVAAAS
ncbi:MAG: aminoglycoside phosphotransferase [Acidimicrobiia bacterium]